VIANWPRHPEPLYDNGNIDKLLYFLLRIHTNQEEGAENDVNFLQAMKKAVPGNTIIVQIVTRMFCF